MSLILSLVAVLPRSAEGVVLLAELTVQRVMVTTGIVDVTTSVENKVDTRVVELSSGVTDPATAKEDMTSTLSTKNSAEAGMFAIEWYQC